MVFSFRFWWLCNSKHAEGVPMAQLFATGIYTTIWTLPRGKVNAVYCGWLIKTKINEAINYFRDEASGYL